MRKLGILALASVTAILFLMGCGGGGGSNVQNIAGRWTGTLTQTRAIGDSGTIQLDYTQNGSTISGSAQLTIKGTVYNGTFTGTLSGSDISITVDYGAYGTVAYTGTVSGVNFVGTYSRVVPAGGIEAGSVVMTKNSGTQTPSLAGTYSGSSQGTTDTTPGTLTMTITQTDNALTFTGSATDPVGTIQFSGTGTVTGNTITAHLAASGNFIDISGTISGNSISGAFVSSEVENGKNLHGSFKVNKS